MVFCDNKKCKYNQKDFCLHTKLVINSERCQCFEIKRHKQKMTNETDINHRPVINHRRNGILK